jgi:hypothetical protein
MRDEHSRYLELIRSVENPKTESHSLDVRSECPAVFGFRLSRFDYFTAGEGDGFAMLAAEGCPAGVPP